MRKGFIFNQNKCVACKACSAACILENGWKVQPRSIFTYNEEAYPTLPVTHLSMACNHCEKPVCLEGCPSAAYTRDFETEAVIIDETKCIGCHYCLWNCPYDAPKSDFVNGIVSKCNLCYTGLKEGREPACTTACPTGALRYGYLHDETEAYSLPWFPEKNLNPAMEIRGFKKKIPLTIIPERVQKSENKIIPEKEKNIKDEWSLVAFTFLASIAVAMVSSSFLNGLFPDAILFILIILLTGIISFFHLGKPLKAWRVLTNIISSPLSREIILYLIFSLISILSVILKSSVLLIVSSLSGLILLVAIDAVYTFSDNRKSIIFHSGQTFLTGLLIISFFSDMGLPFLFIAFIKFVSSVFHMLNDKNKGFIFNLRFFRIAVLIITTVSLLKGISYPGTVLSILFLAGEFSDRMIFYVDFNPLNINVLIKNNIKLYP